VKKILHKQEIEDIIVGATLLGAGGGGSPKTGLLLLKDISEVTLFDLEEIPDDSHIAVVAGMGSPVVLSRIGWKGEEITALEKLQEITGTKFDFVVPVETGGFNSVTPLHAGALKGLPVVDADGAGRAVPELQMTTFHTYGVSASPIVLADRSGNSAVLYASDTFKGERLARAVTAELGMQVGIACYTMTGKQLKMSAIPSALSIAENVGRTIRKAKENREDIAASVTRAVNGTLLAMGTVSKKIEEVKAGFDYGKVFVEDVVVDYKNENMIAWKDGKPIAMVPDLICWLRIDGEPLTNVEIQEGMEVAIIGIKAHEKWHTQNGFNVFKHVLKTIGYEGEYEPIDIH